MELQEKSKILSQLSRLKGEKAEAALTTEAEKSSKILMGDNDYVTLAQVLEFHRS
jgi:hypothetical protein